MVSESTDSREMISGRIAVASGDKLSLDKRYAKLERMIYLLTGMSLLFVAIGFIVTEHNAKYLLSGYNTLREEDRKKVDVKAYIRFSENFISSWGYSFSY